MKIMLHDINIIKLCIYLYLLLQHTLSLFLISAQLLDNTKIINQYMSYIKLHKQSSG